MTAEQLDYLLSIISLSSFAVMAALGFLAGIKLASLLSY